MKETKTPIRIGINNFADILGVHQRTLRIWDKAGILIPKRTEKNRRYYSTEDIKKGEFILFLTGNLLVNLTAVKLITMLLKRSKININDYLDYIGAVAKDINIDKQKQEENLKKSARRGRKRKLGL